MDAPASGLAVRRVVGWDAERPGRHSHAERGDDREWSAVSESAHTLCRERVEWMLQPTSHQNAQRPAPQPDPKPAQTDGSHAPAWEPRRGRSCVRAGSVQGGGMGRRASRQAFPRGAWGRVCQPRASSAWPLTCLLSGPSRYRNTGMISAGSGFFSGSSAG